MTKSQPGTDESVDLTTGRDDVVALGGDWANHTRRSMSLLTDVEVQTRLLTQAVWQSRMKPSCSLELAASGSPRKAPRSGRNEDGGS